MLLLSYINYLRNSMRTNPGGQLAPNEVVGRDREIEQLWAHLDKQSVVITAERRMGKTSVVKKMMAEQPERIYCVYQEIEGIQSPLKFVEAIIHEIRTYLSLGVRAKGNWQKFRQAMSEAKFMGVNVPKATETDWQDRLTSVMADLSAQLFQLSPDLLFVFFWDELPMAIDNIRKECGNSAAMAVLDTLRSIRQTHANLRMVYTGSIGLHHVVSTLKTNGYLGTPTNDMYPFNLPPLAEVDALNLARELLIGEGLMMDDREVVAQTIVTVVDCIPFYIHASIDRLKRKPSPITSDTVLEMIRDSLSSANPWDIDHYQTRIKSYYGVDRWRIALQTLDEIALADSALTFKDICDRVQMQIQPFEKEMQREILTLLQQDHYLDRDAAGAYLFRFRLIRQYWRSQRG
jgi:hypothetical protein